MSIFSIKKSKHHTLSDLEYKKGFTLVEALVSSTIIILLMTVFVGFSKTSNTLQSLTRERVLLITTLNRARALALQASHLGLGVSNRPCGYGVHFEVNANTYYLFHDDAEAGNCGSADRRYTGPSELYSEHGYPEIFEMSRSVQILSSDVIDVVFVPPNLEVFINEQKGFGIADIILESVDGPPYYDETIRITGSGQISILSK